MEDGSTSLILAVDAVNFGLLADAEQEAIIYSYAGLLNSLNFSIQILIRSQTKDVSSYLKLLEEKQENTFDEKKKQKIKEYRQFVGELIKERNVLDKKFYVIIPAAAIELGLVSAQSVIPGVKAKQAVGFDKSVILDKAITNLHPKRDHLIAQFARIGLYARQLTTQEIIQLFYVNYNPEAAEGQIMADTSNYTSPLVEAGEQGVNMMDNPTMTVPTPSTPPAGVPVTPPAEPPKPATPQPGAPVPSPTPTPSPTPAPTPTPGPVPTPTPSPMTPPVGGMPKPGAPTPPSIQTPPAAIGSVTPAKAINEADAQDKINDSIQALGGAQAKVAPVGSGMPAITTPTPAPTEVIKPSGDALPPLPEI